MTRTMLHTERLTLRRATPGDIDIVWCLWREGEARGGDVGSAKGLPTGLTRSALLALIGSRLGLWLLVPRGQHVAVGFVSLTQRGASPPASARPGPEVEFLVALDPAFRSRGYAQEAEAAFVEALSVEPA
jgi:hypothetical protein